MQHFKDANGNLYAYEDYVDVKKKVCPNGPLPNIPDGLIKVRKPRVIKPKR